MAVFPTCLVEYQNPAIGQDLVKVYERNGIECTLVDGAGCCGAPWLHSGDIEQFTKAAVKNVKVLADARARRHDIVVPQPTCSYVLQARTTSTTSAAPTPSSSPSTPTTPPST